MRFRNRPAFSTTSRKAGVALLIVVLATSASAAPPGASRLSPHRVITSRQTAAQPWEQVERALGRKGALQPDGVIRFSFPRRDLVVTAKGVRLRPAFALGSWFGFQSVGRSTAMVMGDLVLTEDEVNPVISALQKGGIEQTALHNHLLDEQPIVMYMHISGTGDRQKLATTLRAALETTKTPLDTTASPGAPPPFGLDTATIAAAIGAYGKINGGVYQLTVPRREVIHDGSRVIGATMGVATAINFQPSETGKAAATGDFVLIASEVNPVIRKLREGGISVTALHTHMLTESPRLFFMHFWGDDDPVSLARTLRSALSVTNSRLAR